MSRRPELRGVLIALALASCRGREPPLDGGFTPPNPPDAAPPPPTVVASLSPPAPDAPVAIVDPCGERSVPRSGKSIGHTSVVFKLELANGTKIAWKPHAKTVKGRYRGEIAAYRLATALGLANVPPACPRTFAATDVAAALAGNEASAKLFAAEAIAEDGQITGAAIPWIEGLTFLPIEKDPLRGQARSWLTAGSSIPADKTELARQLSDLVVFDFVTANWDRYSGENVGIDGSGRVLFIDNDAAFMEGVAKEFVVRSRALLDATDRFSRGFVARLRALDDARLATLLGDDDRGRPILSPSLRAATLDRARAALGAIEGKVAARGEEAALFFP